MALFTDICNRLPSPLSQLHVNQNICYHYSFPKLPMQFAVANLLMEIWCFFQQAILRSSLPSRAIGFRYQFFVNQTSSGSISYRYHYPSSNNNTRVVVTITNLLRDTEYSIQIRAQYYLRGICSSYISGQLSDLVVYRTNETGKDHW